MKYRPEYPSQPFTFIKEAQAWVDAFVLWYNTEHLHNAIRFVAPDDRHYGREEEILTHRHQVYRQAQQGTPSGGRGTRETGNL